MESPRDERIASWVSDFCESPAFLDHPSLLREYAPEVLMAFLQGACAHRDIEPEDIEEADLKPALLGHVAPLEMAGSAREGVPALCAAFLAHLESVGRLAGGRTLGLYVRALRAPFLEAAAGKGQTLRSPSTKLGRTSDGNPIFCASARACARVRAMPLAGCFSPNRCSNC